MATTAVFVYGTLKRGCFNHHLLRRSLESQDTATQPAVFVAAAAAAVDGGSGSACTSIGTAWETVEAWPLLLKPRRYTPALLPQKGVGRRVVGEVYHCDAAALALLDTLEEVEAGKYQRMPVQVRPVNAAQAEQQPAPLLECQGYFITAAEAIDSGLPGPPAWPHLQPADCLRSYADPRYVFAPGGEEEVASGVVAAPAIVFCDFDGTISVADTLDVLIDEAMGASARKAIDQQYEDGAISFRELIRNELAPVCCSFDEGCEKIALACHAAHCAGAVGAAAPPLQEIGVVDPSFGTFARLCHDAGVPLVVLSGGMTQLVQRFLGDALQAEEAGRPQPSPEMLARGAGLPSGTIPVRANTLLVGGSRVPLDGEPGAAAVNCVPGHWTAEFFDESASGNDKAAAVSAWKPAGSRVIFIGDGVSDLPIASAGGVEPCFFSHMSLFLLKRVCSQISVSNCFFHRHLQAVLTRSLRSEGWR